MAALGHPLQLASDAALARLTPSTSSAQQHHHVRACTGLARCTSNGPSRRLIGKSAPLQQPAAACGMQRSAGRSTVRAEAAATGAAAGAHTVRDVDINTFEPELIAAGDKLVVLDMYTQWCGPCKLIAPKIAALAAAYKDVVFLKLDCNEMNKPLAKSLGVRSVPTFKLFRRSKFVGEVVGAKYDELVAQITQHNTTTDVTGAGAPQKEAALAATDGGGVRDVDQSSFYSTLKLGGNRLVVLNMYTAWCAPCKRIAPEFDALARDNPDVLFLRLDCNEENKPLAKGLGVRSVPTFKLFRNMQQVDEIVGAKLEKVIELINANR